ncbi:type-2 restriction enzyme [Candidatus Termititenax aidoneus]|uniref:Type-2 restriction enzyme n=1 Tax=Termititenax aidoneus TaxID=2218524 RepID=A0A388TCD4_TERA1|nr:type-2 restriction enzyme [Candidatus Termititenax aidoneus]
MFNQYRQMQFAQYNKAHDFFIENHEKLIQIEHFCMDLLSKFIDEHQDSIKHDYNEASFLYPFWQNYPPDERGRKPKGDQYPWIEIGEHVFCPKISRFLDKHFNIKDTGLPTGPDGRYIISNDAIQSILEITCSVWLFVDIKSVGPRDDQDHVVMSHNQISGNGKWDRMACGVLNDTMVAKGQRATHPFYCAIPPLFVLSDATVVPVVHIVLKPVYKMLGLAGERQGQPIGRVSMATIPNGILLTENPNYLKKTPGLLFPGKDDKEKDPRKIRARVSFEKLRKLADWRYKDFYF